MCPKTKRRFLLILSASGCLLGPVIATRAVGIAPDPVATSAPACHRRPIDLVIFLDTSGSMEGLIDSARARLWDIVNSLAAANPTPDLRVGLITYGSPSRSAAANGWVFHVSNLTNDLDSIYAKMMEFRTDGGDEFVGWALRRGLDWMSWSNDPAALKMIFIAGNESADQASEVFNFRTVASEARTRGISVNSIFCGDRDQGTREHWNEVAAYGGGSFSAIDMRCGTFQIEAPQDKILLELNMKLNATYLPYGSLGDAGQRNQVEQDEVAKRVGAASAPSRVAAKATALYQNAGWDLVDAIAEKKVELKDVKEAELPPVMQNMPAEERPRFVNAQRLARADIQKQISELNQKREQFVQDARTKASGGKQALDQAMLGTIRDQAKQKGFKFE